MNTLKCILFLKCFFLQFVAFSQYIGTQGFDKSCIGFIISDSIVVGTGFVFQDSNIVVSCAHVGRKNPGPKKFRSLGSEKTYDLSYLNFTINGDLIIYKSDTSISRNPFKGDYNFKVTTGQEITYMGFDIAMGLKFGLKDELPYITQANSIIIVLGHWSDGMMDADFIEFEGIGKPGFSGGPILNKDGKVIAVFSHAYMCSTFTFNTDPIRFNINRAVSAWPLFELLKD